MAPEIARFADWTTLRADARTVVAIACRASARANRHGAFVTFFDATHGPVSPAEPLGGLPFAVKDMLAFEGYAPSCGLPHAAQHRLPLVAGTTPLVERLRTAGADLLGTLHMSELAFEPAGVNPLLPPAFNPWNADVSPGGSSSGPAIAVAEGSVFLALGSDTGGSVRIPAHCCGVTALKPTWGRLPLDGAMPLAPTLDTIGPIARSAADIALAWPVLADADTRSPPRTVTVALARDAVDDSDPQIAAAVLAVADVLRDIGVEVREIELCELLATCERIMGVVLSYEAFRCHSGSAGSNSPLSPVTRKRLERSGRVHEDDYQSAMRDLRALRAEMPSTLFGRHQAILLPVMPILAPELALTDPASSRFEPRTLYRMAAYTAAANVMGIPALALPCGFGDRGVPMAAQLLGPPNGEETLLDLGGRLQARTDWHGRIPPGARAWEIPS